MRVKCHMKAKIIFIHGMFQNGKSWAKWVAFFEDAGFECSAPSWPLHEGAPAELRSQVPAGLGRLRLAEVIEHFAAECRKTDQRPILIGHSVGGLVAQILANRGLASTAVCISSVAPNDLIAVDWHLVKAVISITNPLKGHEVYEMTPEEFHDTFCNTMTEQESARAYAETATPDSRQVLRDCLGSAGRVDMNEAHVPLLFIAGDSDHIIPASLNRRNSGHYSDLTSVTEFIEFPGRGHFICGQPGWQEVAHYTLRWLEEQVPAASLHATADYHR